ncbi:MAG: 4-(cytidine 5'-diphospho)-2-C-methyl-D-erythritol kinase [Myxococcota bacterium]
MSVVRLLAPAKLNLGLRLLARRADGYHDIDTVFVPLRLFDRLEIARSPEPGIRLEVRGAELPDDEGNLAVRAARLACEETGLEPDLRLSLDKRIPVAAGLGGGSSDAAAAILGVEHLSGGTLCATTRASLALSLGADVPFFLRPAPSVGRGVGERLEALADVPEMWWLLVCFDFPVSTAWAYREASRELTLPRDESSIAALLGPSGVLSSPHNDLEPVTSRRHPQVRAAARALEGAGAMVTGMSGSGPTVYGRFESEEAARRAADVLALPNGARTIAVSSPGSASGDWGWGVAKW